MIETRHPLPLLLLILAAVACTSSGSSRDTSASSTTAPTDGSTATTTTAPSDDTGAPDALTSVSIDYESLSVDADGDWAVRGLITNAADADEETVVVTASLLGADGGIVETLSAPPLVSPLRPGERVPFALESTTPIADVDQVLWGVAPAPGAAADREFDLVTYWERGPDDGRAVDMYLYTDPPSGEPAYLLFGSVENTGGSAVEAVRVVVAWLADGKVVATAEVPAELSGRPELEPGAAADWLVVLPADEGRGLVDLQTELWGVAAT